MARAHGKLMLMLMLELLEAVRNTSDTAQVGECPAEKRVSRLTREGPIAHVALVMSLVGSKRWLLLQHLYPAKIADIRTTGAKGHSLRWNSLAQEACAKGFFHFSDHSRQNALASIHSVVQDREGSLAPCVHVSGDRVWAL